MKFGQDLLITGYIDTIDIDLTDTSCRLSVSGRDKTGDLVDSSAIHGSGQWKNVRLEQIVRDICKPFGIEVLVQTDTGEAISSFRWTTVRRRSTRSTELRGPRRSW